MEDAKTDPPAWAIPKRSLFKMTPSTKKNSHSERVESACLTIFRSKDLDSIGKRSAFPQSHIPKGSRRAHGLNWVRSTLSNVLQLA